ncbi:MAG: radical SAM protein [Candidatus Fermentithermobacillus carboniphilus]|uniref:Radical SAM protein n=1 Tax=Candidatus Fermentithermobacillus carboniphilus TaxID=3085328 RepID=A0AAT9LC89_9FIRM|nr:MAG: radical SAM protein [Candidatus Fermentithermobacillus carboniphilus]
MREVTCRSALVRSGIPGVDYVINPYSGCLHRCVYCYASFMSRFHGNEGEWGTWADAKVNVAQILRKEMLLSRKVLSPGLQLGEHPSAPPRVLRVMMASVTDPYQPPERAYKLTRSCLEILSQLGKSGGWSASFKWEALELSILTKSDLVVRDLDILQDIPNAEVGMTITNPVDSISKRYEPGATPSSRRFEVLRRMSSAGLQTWGFFGPVLPYHSDSPRVIREMLIRFRDAGVRRVLVDRFNPYPSAVARFRQVAHPDAILALNRYLKNPLAYLDYLRETVLESATSLGIEVELCF